ncbi:polycystin-2 [Hydra vulgaris]|uniref:polycystin-2 n=1 Tax=Hydra vulgaris TaxID=6087 RepID=UPI0032EA1F21
MGEYKTYFESIVSTFSLLLGKFSFNQYKHANIVLGPIFFFSFNVIIIWIIMNMFLSILNDAFSMVRTNPDCQNNDYEMVNFILEHLKGWFKQRKKKTMTPTRTQSERKTGPNIKTIQVAEYDSEPLRKYDADCQTEFNRVSSKIMENEDLHAVESTYTSFDDLLSKFNYLLNESKLDNEISETIDQIFDEDLFKKFIDCMKVAHWTNKRSNVKELIN